MDRRYQRSIGTITEMEIEKLQHGRVCVVGCGGLGGYVIEGLARMGIGKLTVIDGDCFDETNWNRQLLSTEKNLGMSKALAARERVMTINSQVEVNAIEALLSADNGRDFIRGHQAVVDALDNIGARKALEQACGAEGIPLIHGAIAGWHGQVSVIFPGEQTFSKLYPEGVEQGAEVTTGNPSFTPAVIAALEVAETIKVLLGREEILRNRLLTVDLLNQEYEMIDL